MMPTSNTLIPPSNDFASQIGHAVQEIHPVDPNDSMTNRNISGSSSQHYDVLPPGVESPPPPGCETDAKLAPHKRHNRESEWNVEHKADKESTSEYRQQRRQVSLLFLTYFKASGLFQRYLQTFNINFLKLFVFV